MNTPTTDIPRAPVGAVLAVAIAAAVAASAAGPGYQEIRARRGRKL